MVTSSEPEAARPILVLHAPADEAFARGYLAAALGGAGVRAMSAPELSALPLSELQALIRGSRAAICVITPDFLDDKWAQLGEELAREARLRGGPDIIPITLRDFALPDAWSALARLDLWQRK